MHDDLEQEEGSRRYELNKKYPKTRDQDKKIKNPVSKGSVRSQSKKALQRYVDIFTAQGIDDDEDFDDFAEGE